MVAAAVFLCVVGFGTPSSGWLFDRGLEERIGEMKALFRKRDLQVLYRLYVDESVRVEVARTVEEMRKDGNNAGRIAGRLKFKDRREFLQADASSVVDRFFYLMLHPPDKKPPAIENVHYLRLAFQLSLLFSHLDEGMAIVGKDISGPRAKVYYAGNSFRMAVPFVYKDNRWYLTREGLAR